MAAIGRVELVVPATAIDLNGHVNNVQYVQWMQDAAMAHSAELGWPQERYAAIGRTWIIRSHAIEYQHSAYLGETIAILTWVAGFRKFRSLRKYKFIRPNDEVVLATAETLFIFCDLPTGKPVTIPIEVRAAYTVIDPVDEP
ncbi:MAG: acyl-CoA thioesterase [Desulfobulbus sp.]|jgi:acyl-CoA thioester hydrolase|uniref:acyl-CoA thioesterase n=1 Tax=Desulfobulbus sp. TaxID=895 RepID=UPI00284CFF37|nr:acyl-CoA thioesterase [Desulfobulbus sp.]MDR2551082.1 acyl-CoA thioesterase [Desulfobulbus sp.]